MMAAAPPHDDQGLSLAALLLLPDFGRAVLPFLIIKEANPLRATCHAARTGVAAFPWHDALTPIRGPPEAWKRCFPNARAVNLYYRLDLTLGDVQRFLKGLDLREFAYAGLTLPTFTTRMLESLGNVERLDIRGTCPIALVGPKLMTSLPKLRAVILSRDQAEACGAVFSAAGLEVLVQGECVNCKRFALNERLHFCEVGDGSGSCDTHAPTRGFCDGCFRQRSCPICETQLVCAYCAREFPRLRRPKCPDCLDDERDEQMDMNAMAIMRSAVRAMRVG